MPNELIRKCAEVEKNNHDAEDLAVANSRLETQAMELMQSCEQLARARDGVVAANEQKSAFIANASHEMRTPLSGIIGLTEMVLESDLTDEQHENLNTIRISAESLLLVLNDILDLSKIEAGRLDVESIGFWLRPMLRDLVKLLEVRAAAKQLHVELRVADDVPDCLRGDPGRLRQILTNLAGNAIKFTESGHITIGVEARSRSGEQVQVRFSVADTGIGIPHEKQGIIFEPFRQADRSTSRMYGGSGLGLSISSKLVGLMGGKLEVSSEPGQGSTFWFAIPLAMDAPAACPILDAAAGCTAPCASCLAGTSVLLAEDNPINQKVAIHLLEKQFCRVTVVETGADVLEALEGDEFDLVLMDVQMPDMDGTAATSAIRAQEQNSGKHLPIIAMTAHAMKGDKDRFLAAGMDAYVSKPVRAQELLDAIQAALATANPGKGTMAPRTMTAGTG